MVLFSVEDALRNADSVNDLRLAIKLHGKNSQAADTGASIEGLDII
jgi:twitching motility protein PilU